MVWFDVRGGARIGLPAVSGRVLLAALSRALQRAAKAARMAKNADGNGTNKQRTRARTSFPVRARYNVSRQTHSQVTFDRLRDRAIGFCLVSSA